jgi:molybdopterin-synthase adenylyltransferase
MNSRPVQVRFSAAAWADISGALSATHALREALVFGLASSATTSRHRLVLIREIIVPPEDAFLPSHGHGARWKGAYTIELLNRALAENRGLFIFHSHGNGRHVHMSPDDRRSASTLLPTFQQVAPDRPHGSIVFGDRCAAGMILMPDEDEIVDTFSARWFDGRMVTTPEEGTPDELLLLDRQPLVANRALERRMRDLTVAVVGLSGGGTQVAPQLAALEVGTIIGIDPQRVDRSNLCASSRIGWLDMVLRRWKTSVARLLCWFVNPRTKFVSIRSRIPDPDALSAVKSADVVVGCVNNMHARADLAELCWRYCIPYIDIGLALTVRSPWSEPGPAPLTGIHGNVFVAVPGGPCMWCTEFITQRKLDAETGGMDRSYLRGNDRSTDAWVLSYNATLAGQAVSEVLQLITGYASDDAPRTYKRFNGSAGTMTECIVRRNSQCRLCTQVLAAGDPVWK